MPEHKVSLNAAAITLYRQGIRRACAENYERAIICYQRALDCIENPHASGRLERCILTSLGDAHWALEARAVAVEAYEVALWGMGDDEGHPYLHLRIGQHLLDTGDAKLALVHLRMAFDGDESLFEFEDPRYLQFLESAGCL